MLFVCCTVVVMMCCNKCCYVVMNEISKNKKWEIKSLCVGRNMLLYFHQKLTNQRGFLTVKVLCI